MKISDRDQNRIKIISVTGRLDASTAPQLQKHFEDLISKGKCLFVLELKGVDYISSGGLRVLLIVTKQIKVLNGGLILSNLHPFVEDLLTISGFNRMIPTAATAEEALLLLEKGETA